MECRPAKEADIDDIMAAVADARKVFKKHRVDQWQGEYPTREVFLADMAEGDCFVVTHGGETAGFFVIKDGPEPDYDGITDGKWHWEGKYCWLTGPAGRQIKALQAELMFALWRHSRGPGSTAIPPPIPTEKNEPYEKALCSLRLPLSGQRDNNSIWSHAPQVFEKGMKR